MPEDYIEELLNTLTDEIHDKFVDMVQKKGKRRSSERRV
jgi:hypothetical protein